MNPPSTLTGIELIICNKTREEEELLFLLPMSFVTMQFQRIRSRAGVTTQVTFVRIFSCMSSNVTFHISRTFHEFFTKWTTKSTFYFDWTNSLQEIKRKMLYFIQEKKGNYFSVMMLFFMSFQVTRLRTSISTLVTLERLFFGVGSNVSNHVTRHS